MVLREVLLVWVYLSELLWEPELLLELLWAEVLLLVLLLVILWDLEFPVVVWVLDLCTLHLLRLFFCSLHSRLLVMPGTRCIYFCKNTM